MSLSEARTLAISEAKELLGHRFPDTLADFKLLVYAQPTIERLEIMKAVAFRGWEES